MGKSKRDLLPVAFSRLTNREMVLVAENQSIAVFEFDAIANAAPDKSKRRS